MGNAIAAVQGQIATSNKCCISSTPIVTWRVGKSGYLGDISGGAAGCTYRSEGVRQRRQPSILAPYTSAVKPTPSRRSQIATLGRCSSSQEVWYLSLWHLSNLGNTEAGLQRARLCLHKCLLPRLAARHQKQEDDDGLCPSMTLCL